MFILEFHPKMSHYVYMNIPKAENRLEHLWSQTFQIRDPQSALPAGAEPAASVAKVKSLELFPGTLAYVKGESV